ncbi:MAG: phosphoribosylanthranilate isomerase [Prevotella sp.]|nr:phosphoribosylanthranilate isomerase [Prevotella sp.]
MKPLVKLCGMRHADNIRAAEALGLDMMGFIFWPKSSRYVAAPPAYLPKTVRRVGVFVDAGADEVLAHVRDYGLDAVQLHGHEQPPYLAALRAATPATTLIKAFCIASADDLAPAAAYEGYADLFLFDSRAALPGGNGTQFDWGVLSAYHGHTPFLLSGGIGPDDAARLTAWLGSGGAAARLCAGIDLNSRFETAPAMKDVALLRRFLAQLRQR